MTSYPGGKYPPPQDGPNNQGSNPDFGEAPTQASGQSFPPPGQQTPQQNPNQSFPPPGQQTPQQNPGWQQPPKKGSNSTPYIVAGAVFASLLLIGVGVFFVLSQGDDEGAGDTVAATGASAPPTTIPAPTTTQPPTTLRPLTDDELMLTVAETDLPADAEVENSVLDTSLGGMCSSPVTKRGFESGIERDFEPLEYDVNQPLGIDQSVTRFDTPESASNYMSDMSDSFDCFEETYMGDTDEFLITSESLTPTQYGTRVIEASAVLTEVTGELPPIFIRTILLHNESYTYGLTITSFREIPQTDMRVLLDLAAEKQNLT